MGLRIVLCLVAGALALTAADSAPMPFGVNDGGVDFVDLVRGTNRWSATVANAPLLVDENGWPAGDAQVILFDLRRNMPWNGPDEWAINPQMEGVYRVSFNGQARVDPQFGAVSGSVRNLAWDPATNTTTAEMVVPSTYWLVGLRFTQTRRNPTDPAGTGITNLRVLRPGTLTRGQVFTDATLRAYSQGFHHIRAMNLLATNSYTAFCGTQLRVAKWEDRVRINDAFQGGLAKNNEGCRSSRGHAWEYVIQLANAARTGLWINVPVSADDDYVRALALLLRNGNADAAPLNADVPLYLEYSNEVWNGGFQAAIYNRAAAQSEGVSEIQRYVRRTVEIARIFREVFGAEQMNARVRPVVHWQYTQYLNVFRALQWLEPRLNGEAVSSLIYGIGEAPYYDGPDESSFEASIDSLYLASDGRRRHHTAWSAVAAYYGLKQVGYESGPALNTGPAALAVRHPKIGPTMVRHFVDNWFALGGEAVGFFTLRGAISPFGSWLLTEDFENLDTPRMQAAREILAAPRPPVTAGHALSSVAGSTSLIDASQYVPEAFANEPAVDAAFSMCNSGCTRAFAMYLVRGASKGRYGVSLSGVTNAGSAAVELWIDNQYLGVLTGTLEVELGPGLHGVLLRAVNDSRTQFASGARLRFTLVQGVGGAMALAQPPMNVSARVADGSVTLQWAISGGAASYQVLRSESSAGPFVAVATGVGVNRYVDSGLTNGTLFYYAVAAVNDAGVSPRSAMVAAMPAASAPATPTIVAAAGDAGEAIPTALGGLALLFWEPVPNAVSYTISRAPTAAGPFRAVRTQASTEFRDYDVTVARNATYFYTVTANNGVGSGRPTDPVSITTAPRPPDPPAGLKATAWEGMVVLGWSPPVTMTQSFNPTFRIRRATSAAGPFQLLIDINTCTYLDKSAEAGRTYFYRVSTLKGTAESGFVSAVSSR